MKIEHRQLLSDSARPLHDLLTDWAAELIPEHSIGIANAMRNGGSLAIEFHPLPMPKYYITIVAPGGERVVLNDITLRIRSENLQ